MAFARATVKGFQIHDVSISRRFISMTRSFSKERVDKETCEKIIEAAEAVKDGTREVVNEVKRVGDVVTERVANTAGNMVVDVAKKGFEKAAENAEGKNHKDFLDTAKVVAEAYKDRADKK